jgi:hypothetical protein
MPTAYCTAKFSSETVGAAKPAVACSTYKFITNNCAAIPVTTKRAT